MSQANKNPAPRANGVTGRISKTSPRNYTSHAGYRARIRQLLPAGAVALYGQGAKLGRA